MRRARVTTGIVAGLILLAGCAPSATDSDEQSTPPAEPAPTAEATEAAEAPETPAESTADYLDELYADSLHDGVAPAAPGTAYIEVAGERFEFASVSCTLSDEPGAGRFLASATDETTGSGHVMYINREIGDEVGFDFENELVQLSLFSTENGEGRMSNSMAMLERDRGAAPVWVSGSGTHPLVRVVATEATASGTLAGIPFAPNPAEAEFVAAATCP